MNIPLTIEDLIHVTELLREDILASREILEEHPLDLESSLSIDKSKNLLVKITLATLDVHTQQQQQQQNDDTSSSGIIGLSSRPHFN